MRLKKSISAIIYYLKIKYDFNPKSFLFKTAVKPIIFLSKILNFTEKKY